MSEIPGCTLSVSRQKEKILEILLEVSDSRGVFCLEKRWSNKCLSGGLNRPFLEELRVLQTEVLDLFFQFHAY